MSGSTANGSDLELASEVLDLVGDRAEALVRVSDVRHGLTRFANSFIHQHVGEHTRRVELRVAVDGRAAGTSTSDLSDLRSFVDATIELAKVQPVDPHWAGVAGPADVSVDVHHDEPTAQTTPEQRAELVKRFVEADRDLLAAGFSDTETLSVAVATTAGQRLHASSTRATLDGIHQTGTSAGSAHQTSIRIGDLDGAAAGQAAANRARRSAKFVDVDPGVYEVVLCPEAVATIGIFLALYGFNAKQLLEQQSFVQLGEQQFDPSITIVDDPTDPRAIGLPFDTEGTPKRRLALVERGVSKNVAHDRRTAARSDTTSTGHAVPAGESFGALPTDLVFTPGDASREELISGVERGLLVSQFNYCRVLDPKTQVVTGLTRNGTFLIENGEVAGAVGNLRFTQSFLEAFGPGNVVGIGNDDRFADSEFGPAMVIAPSMRLREWNFTGGARG